MCTFIWLLIHNFQYSFTNKSVLHGVQMGFLSSMSCSSKLIESEKKFMAIWFVTSWSSEVQVIIWTWNWCLKWRMVLWRLSLNLWNPDSYLKILWNWVGFSDTRWNLRIACWCGEASTHTHTLEFGHRNPLSVPNIRLSEWTRKVCMILKYFLCWFFKFPITTVPLLWVLSIIYKDLNENPLLERDIIVFVSVWRADLIQIDSTWRRNNLMGERRMEDERGPNWGPSSGCQARMACW